MLRPLAIVLLLLLTPTALAFSSTARDLVIAYDAAATPVIVGAGAMSIQGTVTGGLLMGGSTTTVLRGIDSLRIASKDGLLDIHDATLEVSQGALLWRFSEGALAIDAQAPYALGLALPEAPIPTADGSTSAGFLMAGENVTGSASWPSGSTEIVPLAAIVSVRDANGEPVPGWESREVNEDIGSASDARGQEIAFVAEGTFEARLGSAIIAGATGSGADLVLSVSPAEKDRFAATVALLERTASSFSDEPSGLAGDQGPLAVLEQVSGLLNGALILVPGDGTTAEAIPREARWGTEDFAVGAFNIVRGDGMSVAWREGELRVEGEPGVALGREGFAVEEPARVGIFPIVSLLLWAIAIGAFVYRLMKKPPTGQHDIKIRLLSIGVYVLIFLLALWLWDRSFTQTFGVGVMSTIAADGISTGTLPRIGTLLVIELIPWGIAGLLFALPVRIAAGIGLRYLGRGKSYKGIATAAGLVSLAVLGPIYALWCFNLIWAQAGRMISGAGS